MKRILLVDDERGFTLSYPMLVKATKESWNDEVVPEIVAVHSISDMEASLKEGQFDIILLDLSLRAQSSEDHGSSKEETVQWIKRNHEWCPPIIVLTGADDDETMVNCFIAGAADYFTKKIAMKFPKLVLRQAYHEHLKRTLHHA